MENITQLKLSSPALRSNGELPSEYTCDGRNISPPIDMQNIPDDTKCLALLMEDPDVSSGTFVHWIVWNMPPLSQIEANINIGISGVNGAGKTGYHGPCPPYGRHKYIFTVYALNREQALPPDVSKKELLAAIKGSVIAEGSMITYYQKVTASL